MAAGALDGSPLVAFVSTTDADRAREFYAETLGLTLVEVSPFALVLTVGGTMLRVTVVDHVVPAPYTVLGWGVSDIAAAVRALSEKGVEFEQFDGMDQDDLAVWLSPSGAQVAWFKDPDGNTLSVTQF